MILYRGCVVEMGETEKIFNNPLHPYTRMLMASVPRLDKQWENIEGGIEWNREPLDANTGCCYYARCPVARKGECDWDRPRLIEVEKDHSVACWLYDQPAAATA